MSREYSPVPPTWLAVVSPSLRAYWPVPVNSHLSEGVSLMRSAPSDALLASVLPLAMLAPAVNSERHCPSGFWVTWACASNGRLAAAASAARRNGGAESASDGLRKWTLRAHGQVPPARVDVVQEMFRQSGLARPEPECKKPPEGGFSSSARRAAAGSSPISAA